MDGLVESNLGIIDPDDADADEAAPRSPAGVTVAIEQFKALRQEIGVRLGNETRLIYLNLAAAALIYGLVLAQHADHLLFLMVPALSGILGFFWLAQLRMLALMGEFIREKLWPYLAKAASAPQLPSWEEHWSASNPTFNIQAMNTLPPAMTFIGPMIISLLVFVPDVGRSRSNLWLWLFDVFFCLLVGLLATWYLGGRIRPHWIPTASRNFAPWRKLWQMTKTAPEKLQHWARKRVGS